MTLAHSAECAHEQESASSCCSVRSPVVDCVSTTSSLSSRMATKVRCGLPASVHLGGLSPASDRPSGIVQFTAVNDSAGEGRISLAATEGTPRSLQHLKPGIACKFAGTKPVAAAGRLMARWPCWGCAVAAVVELMILLPRVGGDGVRRVRCRLSARRRRAQRSKRSPASRRWPRVEVNRKPTQQPAKS